MEKHQSLLIFTLIFSLLVHILAGTGLKFYPDLNESEAPIQVELIERPSQNEKSQQVVMDPLEKLKTKVEELKRKARFLSKNQNLVNEETVAARTGEKTVNLQPNQGQQSTNGSQKPAPNKRQNPSDDQGLYKKFLELQQQQPQQNIKKNTITGFSTRTEHIPNVKMGSATALNTDQFTYYTFYERIQNQLRPRWVNRIRRLSASLPRSEIQRLGRQQQYTEIEVIMSKAGYLENIILSKGSDSRALDGAAMESFRDLMPLLNPPEGMVGSDGKIHIYYGFHIDFRPGPYVRNGR